MVDVCPPGWTNAPDPSWASPPCLGVPAEETSSLRECVAVCSRLGGVPACPAGSEEGNAVAAALVGRANWAWLGLYQNGTAGAAATAGWGRCVAGDAASRFSNWAAALQEPNNRYGQEACAVFSGQGEWFDWPCGVPPALGFTARCLCAGPANASASFAQDLEELEAAWEAHMRETRATVAVLYPVVAMVVLLPSLLLLGFHAWHSVRRGGAPTAESAPRGLRRGWLRRGASADGGSKSSGAGEASEPASELPLPASEPTLQSLSLLRAARRLAARRRVRVSGALGQAGWALLVLANVPAGMLPIGRPIDAVVGPWTYWFCLAPLGGFLLFLALLPTDARAIRAVCAALVAACLVLGSLYLVLGALAIVHPQPGTLVWAVGGWLPMGLLLLAAAAALAPPALPCDGGRHVRGMQPRLALQRLWLVARLFYLGTALLKFSFYSTRLVFHPARRSDPIVIGHLACGGVFLLCAVLATSANRGRVHRWLGRCGGRGGAEDEAVAVAALVGGADPAKALQGAAALFRCLRASALETSDLSASALASTESARTLASKTVRAKLGEVTAFVSHSWCDEKQAPGAKFRAVQRWARAQWTAGGQEPTLWLCKACLHADIEQSLASLPVFLAGCQQLLIVAGPTYSTRLWCVTEVVTFLHMGGELERIEILPLLSSAAGGQAEKRDGLDRLTAQFATFDAAKAQCALAKDRQRLLAAIEAGFGDFKEFNKRVRGVLAARATALQGSQSVGDLRI